MIERRLPATRHRNFRFLWIGGACSNTALWTLLLGNAWIVYKLSDSSFWVGVSTFASMSPYLVAPLGGIVADRLERRVLVRVTRMMTFCVTLVLFVLAATDVIEVWMVVMMALMQGIVRSVEIPSDQALLANVVPPEDLANGVALTSTTQHGTRAIGPLLAGPLLATVGVEGAYGISALMALIAFFTVSQIDVRSRGGVARLADVAENLREGLSYVRHTPPVLALFALVFFHCSLTMSFDAMLPGFAQDHLHESSSAFTTMTFGVGVGALIGTFTLAVITGVRRGPLLFLMALASGASPILMGVSMNLFAASVSATLMGASQAMFMALSAMLLQEAVPDAVRGRVMSLYLMSAGGIMAVMNLAFGTLADRTGSPILFALPGVVFIVVALVSLVAGSHLRRIYRTGQALPAAAA